MLIGIACSSSTPPINCYLSRLSVQRTRLFQIIALVMLVGGLVTEAVAARPSTRMPALDFAAVDQFVQTEMKAIGIPEVALAVVHVDQVVHTKGYGFALQILMHRRVSPRMCNVQHALGARC